MGTLTVRHALLLGLALVVVLAGASHWLLNRPEPERDIERLPPGRWNRLRPDASSPNDDAAALEALGYLRGTREAKGASRGVVPIDPSRTAEGYNLYCSGHGPEAILIDVDGREQHRWRMDWERAFPELEPNAHTSHWRKVSLLPNGDLVAIYANSGLVRLDSKSRLRWALPLKAHHDLWTDEERIVVLTHEVHIRPDYHPNRNVREDFVTVLSHDGELIDEFSLFDALMDSPYASLLEAAPDHGDVLHTNTIWKIPDGHEISALGSGNYLLSFPTIDTVAALDLARHRITWALAGEFDFQHDPTLTAAGELLLFDNGRESKRSRILAFALPAGDLIWSLEDRSGEPFYTHCCGTVQRLVGRNTLVTVSESGTAFEVTPEGEEVWRFESPHRTGPDGEFVATLWELERISPVRLRWLEELREQPDPAAP